MNKLIKMLNKRYHQSVLDINKKPVKRMLRHLDRFDIKFKLKQEMDYFTLEMIDYSLTTKRELELGFIAAYTLMYDYWYEMTYQQRSFQVNLEMEIIKKDLAYFEYNNSKIYLPAFSYDLNRIYIQDITLLDLKQHHNLINECKDMISYDSYGYHIYDLGFCSAKLIIQNDKRCLLFYPVTKCYYLIENNRLIETFSLDPKAKAAPIEVYEALGDAYFNHDEETIMDFLLNYPLIDEKMKKKLIRKGVLK